MKKRYLAAAIIIGAIVLLPKYIASQVTTTVNNLAASINKLPIYSVQVVEINEGWFSSNAILKVGINFDEISTGEIANMPTGEAQFLVNFDSAHGPVIVNDGFAIALVKWKATYAGTELKPIMQWDHDKALYQISGTQQLWSDTELKDQMQAFTIDSEAQNIRAAFSGYAGNGVFSNSHFDYSTTIDKATIGNDENAAEISAVELNMSIEGNYFEAVDGKLFDTDMIVKIGHFQLDDVISQIEVMKLQAASLAIIARVDDENATASVGQDIGVKSATFSGYQIQDLNMELAVNRLSVAFLEKYQQMANQLAGKDPMVVQQELIQFMQDNLLELVTEDPEMDFKNISATLPEGKFDINAKGQTVGVTALPDNIQDPEFWMSHLMAEANLQSDKAVAEMFATNYMRSQIAANPQAAGMSVEQINEIVAQQVPAMLDGLIQQGFLTEENGVYKSSVTLKDKEAVLNGKPIPLPF